MPNPTRLDVHVDQVLTNLSVGWMQQQNNFVADRVFPVVPVPKQSARYFVYDRGDFYRSEMQIRAPGTESAGAGYRIDNTPTYFADVWALHKDVDYQTRANTDDPADADRDAASYLTTQALIRKEKQWVSQYFATGIWTADQTGVGAGPGANQFLQWSVSGSHPFVDIRAQRLAILQRTGYYPNTLVLGAQTWAALADHPDLLDRIKYTQRGIVSTDLVAATLELDNVYIASGIENTAAETNAGSPQPFTGAFIAGKGAWLGYAAPSPGLQQPSAGYTFAWTGLEGANAFGGAITTMEMPWIKSERVEMEMAFAMKVVAPDLGTFFASAVA